MTATRPHASGRAMDRSGVAHVPAPPPELHGTRSAWPVSRASSSSGPLASRRAITTADVLHQGASFGSLLLEQKRRLIAQAHRLTGDGADAEDLLQETLLRCWRARDTFIIGSSIGAWTGTIMRNVFLSGRRRASSAGEQASDDLDSLPDTSGNQEAAVHLRETEEAWRNLPANQRDAVLLAGQGYTTTEGASRLRIAEGTFKSRLSRGRETLRLATGH